MIREYLHKLYEVAMPFFKAATVIVVIIASYRGDYLFAVYACAMYLFIKFQ